MGYPKILFIVLPKGADGFLWIGTGEGLVKYDGIRFQTFSTRDSLADDFIASLFIGTDGKVSGRT
jgi:ligand-binding sensor domain-containing protein